MEAYETVLIGFPILWYTAPNIIKTFLEAWDFSSARIALFATSGGSGMGKTMSLSRAQCSPGPARRSQVLKRCERARSGGMGGYAGIDNLHP